MKQYQKNKYKYKTMQHDTIITIHYKNTIRNVLQERKPLYKLLLYFPWGPHWSTQNTICQPLHILADPKGNF